MNHRQTQFERSAEGSFPYWVCLIEEKCIGTNFDKHREFCRAHGLTLSRHGHAVVWQKEWYQVLRFAKPEHAKRFMQEWWRANASFGKREGQKLGAMEEGDV